MPSYLDFNGLQIWHQCMMDEINWCPTANIVSGNIDATQAKIFNLVASSDIAINITGSTRKDRDEIWISIANGDCTFREITWPTNTSFIGERVDRLQCFRKTIFRLYTYDTGSHWAVETMAEIPYGNSSSWSFDMIVGGYDLKADIPFYLGDTSDVEMMIDWGDGTIEFATSSNAGIDSPSHSYLTQGIYTITLESKDFDKLYLETSLHNHSSYFHDRLLHINSPIPNIAGIYTGTSGSGTANSFYNAFRGCTYLTSIPNNLFSNNPNAIDFRNCFQECEWLYHVPSNIWQSCSSIRYMDSCFEDCYLLTSFEIHLDAENIESASDIFSGASRYAITSEKSYNLYVPANSTSYTTLQSIASTSYIFVYAE